ncbi:MAG: glutamate-5-semialdehyde dehydrogenase [Alphaproteobacteria bacterium]|nr:glutamate-5-semialdehyde dehydrogenase [Alphaproteobacteria bacterium]
MIAGTVTLQEQMQAIGNRAKAVALELAGTPDSLKNKALSNAASALRQNVEIILAANHQDVDAAKQKGLSGAMIDRLVLNAKRIEAMAEGLEAIAALPDPVGRELAAWDRPNGLHISRVSVPLGVIGIIYESRPNVTADAGALCLKSGNTAILRGGSESFHSSQAIVACLHYGLDEAGISKDAIQLVPTQDRDAVGIMLKMVDFIDVIIPRGGKGLTQRIIEESRVPTLQHLDGNCHTYIHHDADETMALNVLVNAKMRRTGVCGATESLVIDKVVAAQLIPKIVSALTEKGCELRGDEVSCAIDSSIKPATEQDWDTEYLDSILSIKCVDDYRQAVDFINQHSSHHTEAVITENQQVADYFLNGVDSAIVMQNASTQFADGGEFGMGAEIGIATGRLHARGPVGVEQLTTFKYVVKGKGQIRPV